jgi:hypothetical protein
VIPQSDRCCTVVAWLAVVEEMIVCVERRLKVKRDRARLG